MKILVLGIGNLLKADDGIGVRVVQLLAGRYRFPEQVTVLNGGTLGIDLLPQVQNAHRVVVIDAVEMGAPPGTVARFRGEELRLATARRLSPHQLGLKDLLDLALALQSAPEEVVLWGVQPGSLELSLELSPMVEARLEQLVEKVLEELTQWGLRPVGIAEAL